MDVSLAGFRWPRGVAPLMLLSVEEARAAEADKRSSLSATLLRTKLRSCWVLMA